MSEDFQIIQKHALALLARREHGVQELRSKLLTKGYTELLVEDVLSFLQNEGLLSDERYVEMMFRHRFSGGYGPKKIVYDLRQRMVSNNLIQHVLQKFEGDWCQLAYDVRCKRFGDCSEADYKMKAKQMRFLAARGFEMHQINAAFEIAD